MTREYAVVDTAGRVITTDLTTRIDADQALADARRDPLTNPTDLSICEVHP